MSDGRRIAGERVYCHGCHNEWERNAGGLECPQCHSEFTEILSDTSSPTPSSTPSPAASPTPPNHPSRSHVPWESRVYPDPDEGDINTVHFNTRLGNGTISFTSRTYHSGGPRGQFGDRRGDPATDAITRDFTNMLEDMMGIRTGNRDRGVEPLPPIGGIGFFGLPPPGARRPGRTADEPDFPVTPLGPMLSAILTRMHNPQPIGAGFVRAGQVDPDMPPHPMILLHHLMNPGASPHGDAAFSQEALDRVISQLMEQTAGSNAPPPASEADIQALPRRPVDAEMLGKEGKAECSICMDSVGIGDEVTFLPCKHWFHGACVTEWLNQHDTCPHCRASIKQDAGRQSANQPSSSASSRFGSVRTGRRLSFPGYNSMPSASRLMPGALPESPPPLPDRRGDAYYDPQRRPNPSRRSESNRSGSSGGGFTGWVRRQLGSS